MARVGRGIAAVWLRTAALGRTLLVRARAEHGEGVISAAIVVLIMAILGAAMWVLFNDVFRSAGDTIVDRVSEIGG